MTYRRKTYDVEAERTSNLLLWGTSDRAKLPFWYLAAEKKGAAVINGRRILIQTPEGTLIANGEDVVMCGADGEMTVCSSKFFEATFEPIVEATGMDQDPIIPSTMLYGLDGKRLN